MRDIKAGSLRLKTWGYPAPWRHVWIDLMKERLGVDVDVVAGCTVTDELRGQYLGYNECMMREIDRKFGAGTVDALAQEAEKQK